MRKNPTPSLHAVLDFFTEIIPYLEDKPIIREIKSGPVLYVGDIHGFYDCLQNAFKVAELKKVHSVVFLGDYTDRGPEQLKSLLKVMDAFSRSEGYNNHNILQDYILEEKFPFKVIALRGNHEDSEINARYGFKEELRYTHGFPEFPIKQLDELYSNLPIIATTGWKTIAIHGGIPKPKEGGEASSLLRYLISKKTPLNIDLNDRYSHELMVEIYQALWNDPYFGDDAGKPNFQPSFRGGNIFEFNKAAFTTFLKLNNRLRLVRAHETAREGYEVHWDEKFVHIFSASPYFERVKQSAFFLEYEDGTGEILDGSGRILTEIKPPI